MYTICRVQGLGQFRVSGFRFQGVCAVRHTSRGRGLGFKGYRVWGLLLKHC